MENGFFSVLEEMASAHKMFYIEYCAGILYITVKRISDETEIGKVIKEKKSNTVLIKMPRTMMKLQSKLLSFKMDSFFNEGVCFRVEAISKIDFRKTEDKKTIVDKFVFDSSELCCFAADEHENNWYVITTNPNKMVLQNNGVDICERSFVIGNNDLCVLRYKTIDYDIIKEVSKSYKYLTQFQNKNIIEEFHGKE
jgi:hypothetical protein